MSWRTVMVTKHCKLDCRMGYLVIRSDIKQTIYLDEIAVLMLENPAVSLTGCLIEEIVKHKIRLIFCDGNHTPLAELAPYYGSHDCSLKLKKQMAWQQGAKDRVWQAIVRRKIFMQAQHLEDLKKPDEAALLMSYISDVEPGDGTNREGFAAKVYFNALFGKDFTRGADNVINARLNYGYYLIMACVSRAVTLNGYLTQLGVFHDNRFNFYNLSCDLMEPFRILIDRCVLTLKGDKLVKEDKRALWEALHQTVLIGERRQTALNAMDIYVRSVLEAIEHDDADLIRFYSLQ